MFVNQYGYEISRCHFLLASYAVLLEDPTNIASVDLLMGCPNSRAGVRIEKEMPLEQLEQSKFRPHH